MHDPLTVAFEIKNPFLPPRRVKDAEGKVTFRYRHSLITIWHKDPETDGSDDSCGWFAPKFTKRQREQLRWMAQEEARDPWFLAEDGKQISSATEAMALCEGAIREVARLLDVRLSEDAVTRLASRLIHCGADNIRSLLAYKPRYHGNTDDHAYWREETAMTLFAAIGRNILREQRPWYRHPRWHIWHWHLQIHPILHFKRWAFSRCDRCGGRFAWGYAPVGPWSGDGPRWFRSEPHVRHLDCDRPTDDGARSAA